MVTISPILEKDLNNAAQEFLRDDLRNRRFGEMNLVVYNSAGTITPTISITQPQADNLLQGKTIDGVVLAPGSPNDIAAWQISFNASPALNLLYAVAPPRISAGIPAAQARAAFEILGELAGCILNVEPQRGFLGELLDGRCNAAPPFSRDATETISARPMTDEVLHCPFVVVRSEVSQDQCPKLNTTAFLLNRIPLQDGRMPVLVNAEAMDSIRLPLAESYAGALDYFTEKAIGPFKRTANVHELRIEGIPQTVIQKFFFGPPLNIQEPSQADHAMLSKKALFTKWQAQATRLGWGPKAATAFLRQLRRQQYWDDLKARCTYKLKYPGKTLRETTAAFSSLITGDKRPQEKAAEPLAEKHPDPGKGEPRAPVGIKSFGQIKDSLQKLLKWEPKLDQGLPKQTQNNTGQRNHSLDRVKNSIKPLVHKSERPTIKPTERSKDHEQGHSH